MDQGNAPIELGKMKENSKCIDAMGNEDMCILVHSEPQALQSNCVFCFFFADNEECRHRTMTIGELNHAGKRYSSACQEGQDKTEEKTYDRTYHLVFSTWLDR